MCDIWAFPTMDGLHFAFAFWQVSWRRFLTIPDPCAGWRYHALWEWTRLNKHALGDSTVFYRTCLKIIMQILELGHVQKLVGGLEHEFHFSIDWGCHHPN